MKLTVAIVGAGAAGLCCARHLGENTDQFEVQVFEKSSKIGGTWIFSHDPKRPKDVRENSEETSAVHSSMYKNLRTNFPKEIMCFPDFPFAENLPSFPHHSDVLCYLNWYAKQYNLYQFIKFNCLVELLEPAHRPRSRTMNNHCSSQVDIKCAKDGDSYSGPSGMVKWTMTIMNVKTGERTSRVFDLVLVCSGHFFKPYVPEIPGLQNFPRKIIHSHTYREPETFRDTRVLVIGNGYSGRDIMIDLAGHAKVVYFCNRGVFLTCPLPANAEQLPSLCELKSNGVAKFVNGDERYVDTVILATGYEYVFPFLTEDSKLVIEGAKRIKPLYKHTFNAIYPSMAIIGMNTGVMPFPYFDLQARWVMSVWKGEKVLPTKEEMIENDEETHQRRLLQGLPPHLAGHFLGTAQWDFYRELAELGGSMCLSSNTEMIYSEWEKLRRADVMNYKYTNVIFDGNKYNFVMVENGLQYM